MAALDQGYRVWKCGAFCLGVEAELWSPGKGCDQKSNHRGQQGQKCATGGIFAALKRRAEGRLMRDRNQGVNVSKKVIK
jgi:hypothetical protein